MKHFRYWCTNLIYWACIYLGLFKGISGAANVAQFVTWFMFALAWLMIFTMAHGDADVESGKKTEHPFDALAKRPGGPWAVPLWFDVLTDIAVILAMVWVGWTWTAGAAVWTTLVAVWVRDKVKDRQVVLAAGA